MKRDLGGLTAREHDVVVIGGGIHGAAAAWDAAQRGLTVALLEARDFGAGTSWNSLKTVHGGLRHLQRADVAGLRESARERAAFLRVAPGLVRPLPFLVPTYAGKPPSRLALAAALRVSDLLTAGRNRGAPEGRSVPGGRLLSPRQVLERLPLLDAAGLTGGAEWTDAQVSSTERLLLAFLLAAAEAGAAVANYVEATHLERKGDRVTGATARDVLGGGTLALRGRVVVNAAGPGLDAVLARAGLARPPVPLLQAANLVLDRGAAATHAVGARSGGRFLFLVPWRGRSIVGTAYAEGETRPVAAEFLDEARRAFPWAGLRGAEVTLVHRGKVPGRNGAAGLWTRSRVVDHQKEDGLAGLLSILSVKYTTARATAERAVDAAVLCAGRAAAPCRTALTALPGALPVHGTLAEQARRAVREEAALHLEDAVLRRLDLGTAGRPSPSAVAEVAAVMAAELGWDASRIRTEEDRLEAALRAVEAR
ncbi:MAG TPA: FAD-dependent oxidoreductase [Vicinamibacteria bacterium]|nr:FAD-dependent oxidoreductase [Vicinamibacteria bacterium]